LAADEIRTRLQDARAAIAFMPQTGCALALVVHAAALLEMEAEQVSVHGLCPT
jgi:hypothetical protein